MTKSKQKCARRPLVMQTAFSSIWWNQEDGPVRGHVTVYFGKHKRRKLTIPYIKAADVLPVTGGVVSATNNALVVAIRELAEHDE